MPVVSDRLCHQPVIGAAALDCVVVRDHDHDPAGVRRERPRRFRPRFHWELLHCGITGHALEGLDARQLRPQDAIFAREAGGVRWHRCLRCDSWLPVDPPLP
ncbi:MAG: hypothetical protein E6G41_15390, partial [Actinobacteria bacterium]